MAGEIHTISCTECGHILGYSEHPLVQDENVKCYLCMHNFCDMADIFNATNLPTPQDLYAADNENSPVPQVHQKWRSNVMRVKDALWDTRVKVQKQQLNLPDSEELDLATELNLDNLF